jgi:hypothetical protein
MLGLKDETRLSSPEELPFKVLTEIGSIASIVGLPLSLIALGFAIYHLMNLRGETRAAREAAEEAQRLIKRETTGTDLTRLNARIQGLIDLLRTNDRERALERFPEIRNLFNRYKAASPKFDSGTSQPNPRIHRVFRAHAE